MMLIPEIMESTPKAFSALHSKASGQGRRSAASAADGASGIFTAPYLQVLAGKASVRPCGSAIVEVAQAMRSGDEVAQATMS
jgi:hypothetical protein